jgi:hypothetical protein
MRIILNNFLKNIEIHPGRENITPNLNLGYTLRILCKIVELLEYPIKSFLYYIMEILYLILKYFIVDMFSLRCIPIFTHCNANSRTKSFFYFLF